MLGINYPDIEVEAQARPPPRMKVGTARFRPPVRVERVTPKDNKKIHLWVRMGRYPMQ